MNKTSLKYFVIIFFVIFLTVSFVFFVYPKKQENKVHNMKVYSQSFEANNDIPGKYTCQGTNVNPSLYWEDEPENTKSLVLLVDDPDAPLPTPFVHWLVFNIPPHIDGFPEATVPEGADQGMNSLGKPGYTGPCPPSGRHRYIFHLYALDKTLQIEGDPTKDIVYRYMQGHIIDQAEIIGYYQKH